MSGICYLAHPIDWDSRGKEAVEAMSEALRANGWLVYDPAGAWSAPSNGTIPHGALALDLESVNETAREAADLTVAYVPSGMRSVGVPAEIARSVDHGDKRVIIWYDSPMPLASFVLLGWDHYLRQSDRGGVYSTFAEWTEQIQRFSS